MLEKPLDVFHRGSFISQWSLIKVTKSIYFIISTLTNLYCINKTSHKAMQPPQPDERWDVSLMCGNILHECYTFGQHSFS